MYLHGHYFNQLNQRIEVHIVTQGNRTTDVEIGREGGDVFFTDDPVEITSSVSDTFDVLLLQQASVRLLTRSFLADLFCPSCRDAVVNILRDGECVFAGYIEPQAYSQDYNEELDEVELSCIDALCALQYAQYRNVGALGVLYGVVKADARQRTFEALLRDILDDISAELNLLGTSQSTYWYDGSKAVDVLVANRYGVFSQMSVNELLFLGDEEDDVWTQEEVMTEILKFLNLHIVQQGRDFYLFDWRTVKRAGKTTWRNLLTNDTKTTTPTTVDIRTGIVSGTDTSISVGEVFNQLQLTCKVESIESVIESPLDSDLLISPYNNYQKYLTEYSSDGEGERAIKAFDAMTHDRETDYDRAVVTDWMMQVRNNPMWTFNSPGMPDIVGTLCDDKINQHALPNRLRSYGGAAIISFGKMERMANKSDNSPKAKPDMTDYLVVAVNGNGVDDMTNTYPKDTDLQAAIPCAVYNGRQSGGVFSPSDDSTRNYIVISGKVVLNPNMWMTDTYENVYNYTPSTPNSPLFQNIYKFWHRTVPSRDNGDGRYYTRKWWAARNFSDTPVWQGAGSDGLMPFTEKGPEELEFKYSAVGDGSDRVSKVAALACMLIIGDQCVVEVANTGKPNDYQWKTYKKREQCASDDEYYQQSFTIGFDPKIGDKLIGVKYDIANNIDYTLGIDAEGTAIPIPWDKHVGGAVQFMILGPVNTMWDDISRRHPTFFRHTKWTTSSKPLLAHVSSIMVEKFEMKIYSDNGLVNNTGDSDIVYLSDTAERFVNKKDDLEMKIHSALTTQENQELGITDSVKMSTPMLASGNLPVLTIYDHTQSLQAKAEQLYVDAYWREYHAPRVLMEQSVMDEGVNAHWLHLYRHPAMNGKTFFVQGIDRNLTEGTATLHLKESDV